MNRTGSFETIGFQATAPGTSYAAAAAFTGNSLQIRNAGGRIFLLGVYALVQGTAAMIQILSPALHDAVNGIELFPTNALVYNLRDNYRQPLKAQDTLTVNMQGSATGGDIELGSLDVYYENLPGSNGVYITPEELYTYGVNEMTTRNTISTGTAGGWSGAEALSAETNYFKPNTYYAIVGALNNGARCLGMRYVSSYFGNLGVAIPGETANKNNTRRHFIDKSNDFRLAGIPVFNSAAVGQTTIAAAVDENGGDPIVNTICVELHPSFNPDALPA